MKTRILTAALVTLAMGGVACAQTPTPPPATGTSAAMPTPLTPPPAAGAAMVAPAMPPGALPPLPPGCVTPAPPAPAAPTPPMYSGNAMQTALSISASQAAQVRQVFQNASQQRVQIDQQRRALDAQTCKRLHAIVGDAGFARWSSAMPPPPPPRGPRGASPPPPPLR